MVAKRALERGFLTKLLEQGIRILLIKECKKISNIKIDIISSSSQIIKGEIQKISIIAENINYKDLLFDKVKLETNLLKINFKLIHKKLDFRNTPRINLKILLSEKSLKTILLSNNWNWIGNMICKELLNEEKLEDIKIKNDKFIIKSSKKNITINKVENISIKAEKGKLYLENKTCNKTFKIPIEEKIYIKNVNIENNLINIFATSSVSF